MPKGDSPRAPISWPTAVEPLAMPAWLVDELGEHGISLDTDEPELLGAFLGLLLESNRVANLTAIRQPEDAWRRHVLDAVLLLPIATEIESHQAGRRPTLIDVGSGCGVPGLPLAIVCPSLDLVLLEATGKKAAFLRHAASQLGLGDRVSVRQQRAESAGRDRGENTGAGRTGGLRDAFDASICRALGPLRVAAELALPFVRPQGVGIFVKGERAEDELSEASAALEALKAGHLTTIRTATARVVILRKHAATPKGFPRGDGTPKRDPL